MPTSNNAIAIAGIQSSLRPAPDFGNWFQPLEYYRDTVNVLTADVARTAASGGLAMTTAGAATFQLTQAGVIAAGDYITILRGGVYVKYQVVSGGTTAWQLSPAPTVAYGVGNVTIVDDGATSTSTFVTAPGFAVGDRFFTTTGGIEYTVTAVLTATTFTTTPDTAAAAQAYGISYQPYNVGSYVDLPPESIVGCRPVPESWRIRFGGTGTLSGTLKFARVDPQTGQETDITTAVATTAAAIWQGVAAVATAQNPMGVFTVTDNPISSGTQNEFVRMIWTAKTTFTTGRTLLLELGFRRKKGPTVLE